MVFSSTLFLFLFLPLVLVLYYSLRQELRNLFLLGSSLFFYAWGETFFVLLMLASCMMNYGLALWVNASREKASARMVLTLAVVGNLSLLAFFKYGNFLVDNLNVVLETLSVPSIHLEPVHLPIGISFFTFQAMSYVIDVYRRDAAVQRNPVNVALYISLFPQLIAGPIVRYHDIATQLTQRTLTMSGVSYGVRRFIIGLGKKVLIANTLAVVADGIFALPDSQLTASLAWLGIVCYTLQIYFDFSGYSDMAIGLGHMFGFKFLENFRYPYVARNIRDFWQRWHISLSSWFRDYLYIPLGGNRCSPKRIYFNLVTVFFLCGLWHGASWTFVIWGLFHGSFLVLERSPIGVWIDKMPFVLRHLYTLVVVMVGWVFFRAETFPQAFAFLQAMIGLGSGDGTEQTIWLFLTYEVYLAIGLGFVGATPWLPWLTSKLETFTNSMSKPVYESTTVVTQLFAIVALGLILLASSAALAAQTHNPFIYFRF